MEECDKEGVRSQEIKKREGGSKKRKKKGQEKNIDQGVPTFTHVRPRP